MTWRSENTAPVALKLAVRHELALEGALAKHTILFLAANPFGTDRLALDEEARAIRLALERSSYRDVFDLETRWAARPMDLLDELRKLKPTVVHFSGHGGRCKPRSGTGPRRDITSQPGLVNVEQQYGLFFQDADGQPKFVSATALRETFGAAGASVKLVVLNACYSEDQAEALLAHVDCVLGMGGSIGDDAARSFAIAFYGGLGERQSVEAAYRQGRAAIHLEGLPDDDKPRLKVRAGIDAMQLVLPHVRRPRARDVPTAGVADRRRPSRATQLNARPNHSPTRSQSFVPLLVATVTGAAGIGLLLVMLGRARMLVSLGLAGHVWYVLLLLVGLAAAVTVFSLFKSYARHTGTVLSGTLELGGPTVVMLVVMVLGFYLVPAPVQPFDVTIFLHGEAGQQAMVLRNTGKLALGLGADKRLESIGDKGEVRFASIPANLRDREVALGLVDDKYELVDPNAKIRLNEEVFYVPVRPKPLGLTGYVSDDRGRPLAQARVSIAGNAAMTDQDGRFEIMLPADLPEGDRTMTIVASGYETWRAQAAPGGNPLQVRLSTSADGR